MVHHALPAMAIAALAAFQRGDLARARQLAEEELGKNDRSPLLYHLMGLIECRLGKFDSGIDWLRRAVGIDQANLPYRVVLARALIDGGKPGEALDVAAVADSSAIELWQVRAEAAFAAGERAIEAEAWQKLCELRPSDPLLLMNLARALLAQGKFNAAEASYYRVLSFAPRHLAAFHELGLTLERTSKIDELRALLDQALELDFKKQALPELWALLELRRGNAVQAADMVRHAPNGADLVRWNRLRVRAFDATGDAPAAFEAASAMNRSVPQYSNARTAAAGYRSQLRDLAKAITPKWAARLPRLEPLAAPRLGFLVGFPRSGTTLADTFLMGHPHCQVMEELPLIQKAAETLGPHDALDGVDFEALSRARHTYLEQLGTAIAGTSDDLIIDKFPLNLLAAPLIQCLFPGAPIIIVQRHPCDVVLSGFMQSFEPNIGMASFLDLSDAADFYDCVMNVWEAARRSLDLPVHTIIYEDLVVDPESVLRPLIRDLGLAWDKRVLDHRSTAKARGPIMNTSYNQVTEPLTGDPSGRWRRYQKQLEPVLPVLLPWAERLGYVD
jgi:Tfp pilus assembly protein PilF